MKQKLKTIKLLLTISLAGLLLFACQVDRDLTNENLYEKNGVIMHKKFEELIKETQFKTAFEKINKPKKGFSNKGNTTSRTVMENQYGFTISDYPANVVVSDSITSYTFLITRENTNQNAFENLIVNAKQNQDPKAYILKYLSTTSFNDVPFNFNTFQGTRTINRIIYNASQINSLYTIEDIVCDIVETWICGGPGNHSSDVPGCGGHSGGSSMVCTGGGGGGSGSSGSSGAGGGGSVPTAPVPPCRDCPVLDKPDPCYKIKKLMTTTPTAQTELADLATKTSDAVEHGRYKLSSASVIQTPPTGSNGAVSYPSPNSTAGVYTMQAHTHNSPASATYSVFSWEDLMSISFLITKNKISSDCVFFLITADGTSYAMTINDMTKFTDIMYNFSSYPEGTMIDMERVFNRNKLDKAFYKTENNNVPLIKVNSNPANDKLNFLKFMKQANLGVDLMTVDNATFTNFTKITLDNDDNIVPTPCQ